MRRKKTKTSERLYRVEGRTVFASSLKLARENARGLSARTNRDGSSLPEGEA